jgi:hypothetical protein
MTNVFPTSPFINDILDQSKEYSKYVNPLFANLVPPPDCYVKPIVNETPLMIGGANASMNRIEPEMFDKLVKLATVHPDNLTKKQTKKQRKKNNKNSTKKYK